MLESRDACEFKLTKPLKFVTGRKDCISDDPEGRAYVTTKHEVNKVQFNIFHTMHLDILCTLVKKNIFHNFRTIQNCLEMATTLLIMAETCSILIQNIGWLYKLFMELSMRLRSDFSIKFTDSLNSNLTPESV